MSGIDGKVALATGAAHSQIRSHAVRLAEEDADVVVVDVCSQLPRVPYQTGTREELHDEAWSLVLDVNLTGVFNTARAAVPALRRSERGGASI